MPLSVLNDLAKAMKALDGKKVSRFACMLPIFAKAPCCLELFGCCCRRLSQHGVGEVLIPLRHCWRDAFFCVCVGSGSFCHDWASHCSVLFWSLDAKFHRHASLFTRMISLHTLPLHTMVRATNTGYPWLAAHLIIRTFPPLCRMS